jgi:two-component system response regulator
MDTFSSVDLLLIEDNQADAELTMRALRRGPSMNQVIRLRDGLEALQYLYAEGPFEGQLPRLPKLILLDLQMPRMNGIDALKRLKSDLRTQSIPVIILSASANPDDAQECLAYGATSYLVKPLKMEAFAEVIRKLQLDWAEAIRSRTSE